MESKFNFDVKSLLNELAPVLVLLELDIQKIPLTAAKLNKEITQSRFPSSQLDSNYKYQPSLIYNLMKNLVKSGLVSRNDDDNHYSIKKEGEEYLNQQLKILNDFTLDLKEFIKEASMYNEKQ